MRVGSKHLRDEPSDIVPPPPTSTSDTSTEASVDPAVVAVPPPFTSNVFDICHTLETVMTIQAAHGQLLVDLLDEIRALRVDLEHFRRSPPPPPFDEGF